MSHALRITKTLFSGTHRRFRSVRIVGKSIFEWILRNEVASGLSQSPVLCCFDFSHRPARLHYLARIGTDAVDGRQQRSRHRGLPAAAGCRRTAGGGRTRHSGARIGHAPGTPAPAGPPPRLVSDPDRDRGWYALVYNRGDVKVTVTGDLNVQALADGTTLAVGPGDDINVASAEDSGDPVIAQMTLNRFPNIPYAVEVVCGTPVSAALCRSEPQLRGLLASIGLLSVPNR